MNQNYYYPYSQYLKNKYQEKVYKLPVNLPVTCPNRKEGSGCTFCSEKGTGFEAADAFLDVKAQLARSKEKVAKRYHAKKFIAYFQNYTNTFLPLSQLGEYMQQAAQVEDIVEIDISTRPDCVREDYLQYFASFAKTSGIGVMLELGLQTVNYHTLDSINRGHGLAEFIDTVLRCYRYRIPVCVHVILNLPGDTKRDSDETARVLSALPIDCVKIHSLYIAKDSSMAEDYKAGKIEICSKEEYLDRLTSFIGLLRPEIAIERLFSRIPEEDSVFSNWGQSWWKLKDEFEAMMEEKKLRQGALADYLDGAGLTRWGL